MSVQGARRSWIERAVQMAVVAAALPLSAGCNTASFSETITPIAVPSGLSEDDVELAVLLVLLEGAHLDRPEGLVRSASRLLGAHADYVAYRGGSTPPRTRKVSRWYLEDFGGRRAVAGLQRGHFAMSVELTFDAREVRLRPIGATPDLRWNGGDRIHRSAIRWSLELSTALRHELGTMKGYRLQQDLQPETSPPTSEE
jgi:hypothetical protein